MNTSEKAELSVHSEKERLNKEADILFSRIFLKKFSDQNFRHRVLSILESSLLTDSKQGAVRKWASKLILRLLQKIFSMPKKDSDESDPGIASDLGKLFTVQLMIKNNNYKISNESEKLKSAENTASELDCLLKNMDFGEFNEAVSNAHGAIAVISKTVSDQILKQHTGKLASIAPSIIELINILLESLNIILKNKDDIPPDFVADFLSGLMNLVNANAVGELANHKNELIRMVHVGNLLQGDGKTPAFQTTISKKADEVFKIIDPVILRKMMLGRAEIKEAFQNGIHSSLSDYPELIKETMIAKAKNHNSKMRIKKKKLENLLGLEKNDLAASVAESIESIDAYGISEVISIFLSIVNMIYENQPEKINRLLSDIVMTIDSDELESALKNSLQIFADTLKPGIPSIVPKFIDGMCDLLSGGKSEST